MSKQSCDRCLNKLCIEKVSVFNSLSHEDMLEIVKMTGHKTFEKGEYLCHEGDKLAILFIVNNGKVKISKFSKEGKEQILNIVSDGGIFGEYHLFNDSEPYNFSAIALSKTLICTLTKHDMDYLLKKHIDISMKILMELSKKLIRTENLAQSLSTINTDSKVAYVLLELVEKYGVKSNFSVKLEIPITREEMANYAGLSRETMSRKLTSLESEGVIKTVGNKIILIRDMDKLKSLI